MIRRTQFAAVLILAFAALGTPFAASARSAPALENEAPLRWMVVTHMRHTAGDNPAWATPDFDDSDWPLVDMRAIEQTQGVHWVRQNFLVWPEYITGKIPAALYEEGPASTEIYFNGELIGRNGVPGASIDLEQRGKIDRKFFVPARLFKPGNNVLAVRFSSHIPWDSSPLLALGFRFGPYQDERHNRFQDYLPSLLLIGAIGAASLFFGVSFVLRRDEKSTLWLSLMLLCVVSQFTAEVYRGLFSYDYIWHVFRLALAGLFAIGAGIFLNLFIEARFGAKVVRNWILLGVVPPAVVVAAILFGLDIATYSASLAYVGLACVQAVFAVAQKLPTARLLLGGLLLFSTSFLVPISQFLDGTYYYAMSALSVGLFVWRAATYEAVLRQAIDAELLSNRLRMELLKKYLQPHFVMNTLMALSEWIVESPKTGIKMIHALATEFQILHEVSERQSISIKQEIALCKAYLDLMSFRRNKKFSLKHDIVDLTAEVPPAVFHTLIENALSHNRYGNDRIEFELRQIQTPTSLEYIFRAPLGEQVHRAKELENQPAGIGLSYVRARLREMWGTAAAFEDGQTDGGMWQTRISIDTRAV